MLGLDPGGRVARLAHEEVLLNGVGQVDQDEDPRPDQEHPAALPGLLNEGQHQPRGGQDEERQDMLALEQGLACLRRQGRRKGLSVDEIADRFQVSRRTVFRALATTGRPERNAS